MATKRLFILAFISFILVFGAAPKGAWAAFGISPPFMNADHLVKGAAYSQTIYLVQDQPNQDLPVQAALDISDSIRPWFSIDKGFNFVIPQGVRQFPVKVTVQVPADAGLGSYHGTLTFTTQPGKSGQVTIALGAQAAINLTIGTGIYENFNVPLIRLLDVEEGWAPRVYVRLNNQGNISETFSAATYELFDQFGAVRLAYLQKNSGFPEVPAFTEKDYTIDFPVDFHLGVGQYWGNVVFYQNDKVIASQKTIFNVLKAGSLSGWSGKVSFLLKNYLGGQWPFYSGGIVIVLGAAGVWFLKKRRRFGKD